MQVSIVERKDALGIWSVEAIDVEDDGAVFQAQFIGPNARARAEEYATWKYGSWDDPHMRHMREDWPVA